MNTVATPRLRRDRMARKSESTSCAESELVGSSRMSTLVSSVMARAISTSWACPGGRSWTRSSTSASQLRTSRASRAFLRVARQSMPQTLRGLRGPRRTFSPTESSLTSVRSWVTIAMPAASESTGFLMATEWPFIASDPESGAICAERIFSIVDLPDPFSPQSACTSPPKSAKSTPVSARTPP